MLEFPKHIGLKELLFTISEERDANSVQFKVHMERYTNKTWQDLRRWVGTKGWWIRSQGAIDIPCWWYFWMFELFAVWFIWKGYVNPIVRAKCFRDCFLPIKNYLSCLQLWKFVIHRQCDGLILLLTFMLYTTSDHDNLQWLGSFTKNADTV